MEKMDSTTNILTSFLRQIADDLEKRKLTDEQVEKITELYISYLAFNSKQEFSQGDIYKFFALGWYIYTYILAENKINEF